MRILKGGNPMRPGAFEGDRRPRKREEGDYLAG